MGKKHTKVARTTNVDNRHFTSRQNLDYIEQIYQQFKANPEEVSSDWKMFFSGVEFAQEAGTGLSSKELDVYNLIIAYRNFGHYESQTNPIPQQKPFSSSELTLSRFNLSDADLDQTFQIGSIIGKPNAKLRDIIAQLKTFYCGKLTIQAADAAPEIRQFFINEFEKKSPEIKLKNDEKNKIYQQINQTEVFEKFIHTRFVGTKRFSVEGGDALLPMLHSLVQTSCDQGGIEEIVIGMAHRGRLNVLVNFMDKHIGQLLAEFGGPVDLEQPLQFHDGDVKYHMGYKTQKQTPQGKNCEITLAFNPSHLEAVNTVVIGMARAAQRIRKDTQPRKKVLPILIHGDAAFAGQGIVTETLQMAKVSGYKVGGCLHIVIDNQVGFTTNPVNSRSSHYASDIAKALALPVLQVNGDDVESCVKAMEMATRYRQQFGSDIVISVSCYRRYGHNEGDEPAYTQPQMYDWIKQHPTLRELYAQQLQKDNVLTSQDCESMLNKELDRLQAILDDVKVNKPKLPLFKFEGPWQNLRRSTPEDFTKTFETKADLKVLQEVGNAISTYPQNFNPHPKLLKLLDSRKNMTSGKEPIDWGMGELLAYGSLLHEGNSVRLSGQDCCRGTFTHRHAVLYDHKTGEAYNALKTINSEKVNCCIYDSVLSEYGVLGFEYGNSITDPNFLTIWEAQFGDFANGAQIIIDQFIAAGESKWQQMSGLVMLLPHGYEGQGPEHSSARLERFLQLAAQYNMQICNLTTPAQIFHALRRQVRRPFRKPLVVMSPKILLRHPKAVSTLDDLTKGHFQEVIDDSTAETSKVDTVLLCSGKIYYELLEERAKKKDASRFAIVRLEQIYPFPHKKLGDILKRYPKLKTLSWIQEEPKNNGAWNFVYFRMKETLDAEKLQKISLGYAGRDDRSSPAVGSIYKHKLEQQSILEDAFKF